MLGALKLIITRMLGTAFKALVAKTVLVFVLRLYAKGTDTKVDDRSVDVFEALLDNDVEAAREAIKLLSATWLDERNGQEPKN